MYKVLRTTEEYRVLLVFFSKTANPNDEWGKYYLFGGEVSGSECLDVVMILWDKAEKGDFSEFFREVSEEEAEEYMGYRVWGSGWGEAPERWFASRDEVCNWFMMKAREYSTQFRKDRTPQEDKELAKSIERLMPADIKERLKNRREKEEVWDDIQRESEMLAALLKEKEVGLASWHRTLRERKKKMQALLKELGELG